MGASWFVRPTTRRLSLSDGHWMLVKDRLTTGEWRAHLKRSNPLRDGVRQFDNFDYGLSVVVAYLLDWSLDGEAPIRGMSEHDLMSVLDTLASERFAEIKQAIEQHEAAMAAERTEEKKTIPTGESTSSETLSSPSV